MHRVQTPGVSPQLLHSPSPECVAGSYQNVEVVLHQPETDLRKISRLSNTIHSTEGDDVRLLGFLGLHHIPQDINPPLRSQQLHKTLCQGIFHCPLQTLESAHHNPFELHKNRLD